MKKNLKPLILSIMAVLFILSLALPSFAANTVADDNYEQGKASISTLNRLCEDVYVKKPNASVSNAGGNTCSVIVSYRTQIELLMYSESAWSIDLRDDIKLLEKKGISAGTLSWIYYSHPETVNTSAVKETYLRQLDIINGRSVSDVSFFDSVEGRTPEVERCYTLLLQSIYTAKIQTIYEDGDSETVKAMLLAYPSALGSACKYDPINSDGEDASNYRAFFANVLSNIEKQRNKDKTEQELYTVFTILFPNENYDTSARLTDFKIALKTKNAVTEMNELLALTVNELLDGLKITDKEYRNSYLSKKKSDVILALDVANSGDPVSLMPISLWFSRFDAEICSADAKDTLCEYSSSLAKSGKYEKADEDKLQKITDEYTSSGGILDSASSIEKIKLELTRATARCMWFDVYRSTVTAISSYKGDHASLLVEAREKYESTDKKIAIGERDGATDALTRLSIDIEAMRTLCAHSEAIGFTTTHVKALSIQNASANDVSALASALRDAHSLSSKAQSIISDKLIALSQAYKEANISLLARSFTDSDELREYSKAMLSQYISSISPKKADGSLDLRTFCLSIDLLTQKAETLEAICELFYTEYLSGEGRYFYDTAVSSVKDAANDAKDKTAERLLYDATVDILRVAALERIYVCAEGYTTHKNIPSILEAAKTEITEYTERSQIQSYADTTVKEIESIILEKIVLEGKGELGTLKSSLASQISDFKYISDAKKEEALSSLLSIYDSATGSIAVASTADEARDLIETAISDLNEIFNTAISLEKEKCLDEADKRLVTAYGSLSDYSETNAQKISDILNKFNEDCDLSDSVAKYEEHLSVALLEIGKIENKLKEAQRSSKEKLNEAYSLLIKMKDLYGTSSLSELEDIYSRTLTELNAITDIKDTEKVYELADERIALMKTIRLDMIFTEDNYLLGTEDKVPDGYEPSADGYIGAIYSNGGIPSNVKLSITNIGSDGILELIQKAAKEKRIIVNGELIDDRKLINALKKCEILSAIDIDTGIPINETGYAYSVSMLLPDTLDASDLIGIVFVRDDGSLEFYEATTNGSLLEFDTTHFSKYYLVKKGTVDLVPLMICLGLIILCEIAAIVLLLLRRRKMKGSENEILSAFVPFALSVNYRPTGGRGIVAIMGFAAISMAALIAYLLYLEHRDMKKRKSSLALCEESDSLTPVHVGGEEISDKSVNDSLCETNDEALPSMNEALLSEEEVSETEPLSSISVTEAEELMGDVKVDDLYSHDYEDLEIYHGDRKGQINIDTISVFFEDGDVVTLNSLKEKRLVGTNIGYVKILARGILDKRLTIVAQDFSASAVKMIHLTGGKAVLTHPSPQRNAKSNKN